MSKGEVQVRSIPADPKYTDWELEAVAHALNTVPLPQEIYEVISDLHSAVMGLMREVRNHDMDLQHRISELESKLRQLSWRVP